MSLPFQQTREGARVTGARHWLLQAGSVQVGVLGAKSRALPGHWVLRVPRFGRGMERDRARTALTLLRDLTRREPVLRLHVEIWSEREEERAVLEEECEALGFVSTSMRSYRNTLWIDLRPSEEEILMGFSQGARRKIRLTARFPVALRPIVEAGWIQRLEELDRETGSRTGLRYDATLWREWLEVAKRSPDRCRILGLFRTDQEGPRSLLAYAAAVHHGTVAEYAMAGSTRDTDLKVPMHYAAAWDLMRWARGMGAAWWDFGGITLRGEGESADPRKGISDFKRSFSKNETVVGAEYAFIPSAGKERVARFLSRCADRVRRIRPW